MDHDWGANESRPYKIIIQLSIILEILRTFQVSCSNNSPKMICSLSWLIVINKIRILVISLIGPVGRVFANGPGDRGSIPSRVIPKTFKMVLDTSLLNSQHYKVLSRVKWSNPGKRVALTPTPRCSSYWKGSLLVALDYSHQLYYIYIERKIDR